LKTNNFFEQQRADQNSPNFLDPNKHRDSFNGSSGGFSPGTRRKLLSEANDLKRRSTV